MTAPLTADAFAEQLRASGCRVEIDRSYARATYLRASKVGETDTDTWIVFEGDRFKRAFAVWIGVSRRRWPKFRTMKSIRAHLGVTGEKTS
jgi:hypothetical protein